MLGARARLRLVLDSPVLAAEDTHDGWVGLTHEFGLAADPQECSWVMAVDRGGHYIRTFVEITRGTYGTNDVFVPATMAAVLACGSDRWIWFHNHPSGDPTPSEDDMEAVRYLKLASTFCGLTLEDAIIVTPERDVWLSMDQAGLYAFDHAVTA